MVWKPVNQPLVKTIPLSQMGQHMRELSPSRQAFVEAVLLLGTDNFARAAEIAGYAAEGRTSLAVTAHRLAHNDKVQRAIQEESKRRMVGMLPLAIGHVRAIMENSTSDNMRLRAAQTIMDRGGMAIQSEQKITIKREDNSGEQIERIVKLAKNLGLDPQALLGQYGVKVDAGGLVIEGTVEPADPGSEGLEDLL